jgi:hypothetical protein
VSGGDIVRPPHGSASCACLFCWHDIATLTAELAAERAEVERLRQTVRDRDGWNEHLVAEGSHLLLEVPRPFRMIVHRRAERIAHQEACREQVS